MPKSIIDERLHQSHILIVEDSPLSVQILEQCLKNDGFTKIFIVHNGQEALDYVNAQLPDIIVLDIMMPVMDGQEFCQIFRNNSRHAKIPIIVQTALDGMKAKIDTFKMGASDYIYKPIVAEELIARIKVHLAQKILLEDLEVFHEQMHNEIKAASFMQKRLMPSELQTQLCENVYNIEIAHHYETSSIMGGDCWGMRALNDSQLSIYMFDFSGHGITAAMNVFRMHTIMQEIMHTGSDPSLFLSTLNHHIHPLLDRNEFATMFYGVIDVSANCIFYASAATAPTMIFHGEEKSCTMLDSQGLPLGVTSDAVYETRHATFNKGDTLLLFSDCLNETTNSNNQTLSEADIQANVLTTIQKTPDKIATAVKDSLLTLLQNHNPSPVRDDLTVNVYHRR